MKTVLIESQLCPVDQLPKGVLQHGWGNGYVLLPPEHVLAGINYDDINSYVTVHGGLTFSEPVNEELMQKPPFREVLDKSDLGCWMVGFDTNHYGDGPNKWPRSKVLAETLELEKQLETLGSFASEKRYQHTLDFLYAEDEVVNCITFDQRLQCFIHCNETWRLPDTEYLSTLMIRVTDLFPRIRTLA